MFTSTKASTFDSVSFVIYGQSGIGKTSLVKTIPENSLKEKRVLIINAESGLLPLRELDLPVFDLAHNEGKEIPRGQRIQRLAVICQYLKEHSKDYDFIILDSVTEIGQCLVEALKGKYPDKKDGFLMWGEYSDKMMAILKSFRDLKINTILLFLENIDKDENGSRYHGVDLQGKIATKLIAYYDEVFCMIKVDQDNGQTERRLITGAYQNFIAKDRSGKLDTLEPANINLILNKIKG